MSHIIAKYVGARVLNKYWKHILIAVSIIGVVVFFLLFGTTGSIIQTGTGELPQTSISHISTFEDVAEYSLAFTITATDSDADLMSIEVQMKSSKATAYVEGANGAQYNISNWVTVWTEYGFEVNQTSYTDTIRIIMFEKISFSIRSVVEDAGENIVFHEISSSVSAIGQSDLTAPAFEIPVLITALVAIIALKQRKEQD